MNNTFPIDFDALQKGDFVRQEKIESIYLVSFRDSPDAYRFSQMHLVGYIRARRQDLAAHIKCTGNDIEILSDLQADAHTYRQIIQAQTRLAAFNGRRASIDRSGFSLEERATAESRDRIGQAAMIGSRSAIEKAKRDELLTARNIQQLNR